MSQLMVLILIVGPLLVSTPIEAEADNTTSNLGVKTQRHLAAVEERPDLGISASIVARLRSATHKRRYRIGELIKVEVTLVNLSKKSLFFRRAASVEVLTADKMGKKITVNPYLTIDTLPTPESYVLLKNFETSTVSYQLRIGCDERAFKQMNELIRGEAENEDSEANLFLKWGNACLSLNKPGTYHLTFELSNRLVLVSPNAPFLQTAVGTIRSERLVITIAE